MATEGILGRSLGSPKRQDTLIGRSRKRSGIIIKASSPVRTPKQQDFTCKSSLGGCESPPLPSWAPEEGMATSFRPTDTRPCPC